jgi:lysozyme family protein
MATPDRFSRCLDVILRMEGGFVDNPKDPGGATSLGVTIGVLGQHLGQHLGRPATVADVKALTPATVAPIYRTGYWDPVRADDLPAGLDLIVFDTAVNMGVGVARVMLQRAAGVVADGHLGPATLAAIAAAKPAVVIDAFAEARDRRYRALADFPTFGKGWLARVAKVEALALADAAAA